MRYATWIDDAWSDPDPADSLSKWQRVFGDRFRAPKREEAALARAAEASLPIRYRDTQQRLTDLGIVTRVEPRYRFRITGKVLRKGSMGAYYLKNRGNRVLRNRRIRFEVAECNVPEPYRILWKVLNRGPLSMEKDSIRGQIEEGGRVWRIEESTDFAGPHYVECYIVKDGVCVATDRQEVIII